MRRAKSGLCVFLLFKILQPSILRNLDRVAFVLLLTLLFLLVTFC